MQKTLRSTVRFKGFGLHTGQLVSVVVKPAPENHGIVFVRVDCKVADNTIPALWHCAKHAELCTLLENKSGVHVATVEHLMAALAGCGIHNAVVEIDAAEVPIMDGSAIEFAQEFLRVGLQVQDAPVRAIKVLSTVKAQDDKAYAQLEPSETPQMDFHIEFAGTPIGKQNKTLELVNGAVLHELSNSRTFCLKSNVQSMRSRGLIKGGSLKNAVVFGPQGVETPGGLRHDNEPVRHKMLDAFGDLALAGLPIIGRYIGHRAGHTLTNKLLHALFAQPESYQIIECDDVMAHHLPGSDVCLQDIRHFYQA